MWQFGIYSEDEPTIYGCLVDVTSHVDNRPETSLEFRPAVHKVSKETMLCFDEQ